MVNSKTISSQSENVTVGIISDTATSAIGNFPCVDETLDRMKEVLGIKSDADLARYLKEPHKKVGIWRYRNALPYAKIIAACVENSLDLGYILTGTSSIPPEGAGYPELVQIQTEASSLWENLDTVRRYELASRILKIMAEYKPAP